MIGCESTERFFLSRLQYRVFHRHSKFKHKLDSNTHSGIMETFNRADSNSMSFSDDDDLRLFESLDDPELARKILRVKHNDPEVKCLELGRAAILNERVSSRLGDILGQSTNVEELSIMYCNLDVVGLGAGF